LDEAYIDKYLSFVAKVHGVDILSLADYKKMLMGPVGKSDAEKVEWMTKQVYIALGVAMAAAAENHIDATPMEGFDPKAFDEILGLSALGFSAKVLLAVGFRSDDDKSKDSKKIRFDIGEIFIEK
jgi:hypothetical protein